MEYGCRFRDILRSDKRLRADRHEAFQPANGIDSWSFTFDATALNLRDHRITARAEDGLGGEELATVFVIASPDSPPAPNGATLVPGTPIPFENDAAPVRIDVGSPTTIYLEIVGHSENRGYADDLQARLDAAPPGGHS